MQATITIPVLKVVSNSFTDKETGQLVTFAKCFYFDETANDVRYCKVKVDLVSELSLLEGQNATCVLDTNYNKIIALC